MKKLILLLSLVLISFQANAGILIEPYYGMINSGSVEGDGDFEEDYTGTEMGARLGWTSLGLQLGVDYRIHSIEFETRISGFDVDFDVEHTGMYAFIGYQFPVMFRLYGAYAISGNGGYTATVNGAETEVDYEGFNSTILGASYTGLPFVAINFEVVNFEWDEDEDGNEESNEWSHYLLSVSIPISL